MPTMLPARIGSHGCSVETPPMWTTASTPSSSASTCALSSSDAVIDLFAGAGARRSRCGARRAACRNRPSGAAAAPVPRLPAAPVSSRRRKRDRGSGRGQHRGEGGGGAVGSRGACSGAGDAAGSARRVVVSCRTTLIFVRWCGQRQGIPDWGLRVFHDRPHRHRRPPPAQPRAGTGGHPDRPHPRRPPGAGREAADRGRDHGRARGQPHRRARSAVASCRPPARC